MSSSKLLGTSKYLELAAPASVAAAHEAAAPVAARRCLIIMLFASIFFQRLALQPAGGIALNLVVTLAALAALAACGALVVDVARTALFCAFAACVTLSTTLNAGAASLQSAGLTLVIYAPYVLSLRRSGDTFWPCVDAYQRMVLVCAILGIAQFASQFAVGFRPELFTFQSLLPAEILLTGYDNIIPLQWGSSIYKANGFFFIEPSTFSQYLAIAIIFELLFYGTTWRLLAYGQAMIVSYSGTGMLLLALMLPWVLIYRRAYSAIAAMLAFSVAVAATGDYWHLDAILQRLNEFGSPQSSGHARLISGFWLIWDFLLSSPRDLLFGLGPGTIRDYFHLVAYEAHDPPWAKIVFEYGLLGTATFCTLFASAVYSGAPSRWVSAMLTTGFIVFGGMLLDPRLQVLILVFCVLPTVAAPERKEFA